MQGGGGPGFPALSPGAARDLFLREALPDHPRHQEPRLARTWPLQRALGTCFVQPQCPRLALVPQPRGRGCFPGRAELRSAASPRSPLPPRRSPRLRGDVRPHPGTPRLQQRPPLPPGETEAPGVQGHVRGHPNAGSEQKTGRRAPVRPVHLTPILSRPEPGTWQSHRPQWPLISVAPSNPQRFQRKPRVGSDLSRPLIPPGWRSSLSPPPRGFH